MKSAQQYPAPDPCCYIIGCRNVVPSERFFCDEHSSPHRRLAEKLLKLTDRERIEVLLKRIAELEKALQQAKHPHNTLTCLSQAGGECNCGAAERNAAIDAVLRQTSQKA
jgi:hypothetical protein